MRTKPTRKTRMKRDDMRDERADTEAVASTTGKREGESREQGEYARLSSYFTVLVYALMFHLVSLLRQRWLFIKARAEQAQRQGTRYAPWGPARSNPIRHTGRRHGAPTPPLTDSIERSGCAFAVGGCSERCILPAMLMKCILSLLVSVPPPAPPRTPAHSAAAAPSPRPGINPRGA